MTKSIATLFPKLTLLTTCLVLVLKVSSADANMREYQANVEDSTWSMSQQTRLTCELSHEIPGYGQALFVSEASKQLNVEFTLDMKRLPSRYDIATLYSKPPKWMPGVATRRLASMDLRKQYSADLPEDATWQMLTELEKGFFPTILYQDWLNPNDQVAVGLNASNFESQYSTFSNCISNLLPYSFEDIAYTVLSYKKNSAELTKYSQRRLDMIGDYLKEDLALELVLMAGYTDSYGGSWANEQLSIKRANEIRDYFASMGVDGERIEVNGYGEKRHIAPNDNQLDRAKNRRVVIRMAKS